MGWVGTIKFEFRELHGVMSRMQFEQHFYLFFLNLFSSLMIFQSGTCQLPKGAVELIKIIKYENNLRINE